MIRNKKPKMGLVYILELKKSVWKADVKKPKSTFQHKLKRQLDIFREENVYKPGKKCVYVGSTRNDFQRRLHQHLYKRRFLQIEITHPIGPDISGVEFKDIGAPIVRKYFKDRVNFSCLIEVRDVDLSTARPLSERDFLQKKEKEIAEELRLKGWGVYQK